MAENENGQERTEQATGRRLQQARERGQVPRSRELNTALLLLSAAGAAYVLGPSLMDDLSGLLREYLTLDRRQALDPAATVVLFRQALLDAVLLLAPFFAVLVVAAVAAPLALGGWVLSTQAMAFKWERMDPVKGVKRLFAWRGLVELLKALAKFVLVAGVGAAFLYFSAGALLGLGGEPVEQAVRHSGDLVVHGFLALAASLLLVAAVDVPFQIWDHARQLKMTRQEIKDENKETEGNPQIRARVRSVQREMAQRRMMAEVPKADVVVTNPQHYAVALRYEQRRAGAPRVVAKGADLLAARIRGIAADHQVPLISAPPLARALYHSTEVGEEIPAGLYLAVAQLLAYVYQLRRRPAREAGRETIQMDDLPIPDDLRYDR